ncbi:hypothetical protein JCM10908_003384 [Rhodotorula pacifica]|uniref:uncharacterized protein n=1 Tax=Rhodotorula pacifica TaxID=1495444 RepID=UPI0031731C8F
MPATQPSAALPALAPAAPSPAALASSIHFLSALFVPSTPVVDLREPITRDEITSDDELAVEEQSDEDEPMSDEFEVDFARDWLGKVVAIGSRKCARGEDDDGAWEGIVDAAAGLLADLSGPGAQGASTQTYILPSPSVSTGTVSPAPSASSHTQAAVAAFYPTPPPTRPPSVTRNRLPAPSPRQQKHIQLTLRDGTQLEASTGHRTWGAATLFAQSLATRAEAFFPPPSDRSGAPLRVLEVGSGTGLVGMAAAKVLDALKRKAEITLSDGGDEPEAVLQNLRHNVAANFSGSRGLSSIDVRVQALDWRDFVPAGEKITESPAAAAHIAPTSRYDIIFGSDLAYERGQATLLHAAVAAHLAFPSSSSTPESAGLTPSDGACASPTFHLMLPLRPTHKIEMDEVEALFPPAAQPGSLLTEPIPPPLVRQTPDGKLFRLVTFTREQFLGPDGFGAGSPGVRGGSARRRGKDGQISYELRRIGWEEVPILSA